MSGSRTELVGLVGRPLVPFFDESDQVNESLAPQPGSCFGSGANGTGAVELSCRRWNVKDGYFEAPVPVTQPQPGQTQPIVQMTGTSTSTPPLAPTTTVRTPTLTPSMRTNGLMLLTPSGLLSATKAASNTTVTDSCVDSLLLPPQAVPKPVTVPTSVAVMSTSVGTRGNQRTDPRGSSPIEPIPRGDSGERHCKSAGSSPNGGGEPVVMLSVEKKKNKSSGKKKGKQPPQLQPHATGPTVVEDGNALIAMLAASLQPTPTGSKPLQLHITTTTPAGGSGKTLLPRSESLGAGTLRTHHGDADGVVNTKGGKHGVSTIPPPTNTTTTSSHAHTHTHRSSSSNVRRDHDGSMALGVGVGGKSCGGRGIPTPKYYALSAYQCAPDPSMLPIPTFQ